MLTIHHGLGDGDILVRSCFRDTSLRASLACDLKILLTDIILHENGLLKFLHVLLLLLFHFHDPVKAILNSAPY